MCRQSRHGRPLVLLAIAWALLPQTALAAEAVPVEVDVNIDIAGIHLHVDGVFGEEGTCCGNLVLELDPSGALVPDLPFLKKWATKRIAWHI